MTGTRGNAQESARGGARGFTLIELMVVIVIVGILATIAVIGFRRWTANAHRAEAVEMINAIRVAQENYHTETGLYLSVSSTLCVSPSCTSLYPQMNSTKRNDVATSWLVGDYKVAWTPNLTACTGECATWQNLPVHDPGGVMYGYSTVAGRAGDTLPTVTLYGTQITWPTAATASDWFLVTAVGDTDGSGPIGSSGYNVMLGTSWSNDIVAPQEHE